MFSRTMESVFNNVKGFDNVELYMAHGRPIPECFNEPLQKALDDKCDWIWFVEEDMIIPPDTLKTMLSWNVPVVTVDYADRRTGIPLILRDIAERVIFSGMGCMLIKAEVFKKMEQPYVRPMVFHQVKEDNGDIRWEPQFNVKFNGYGGQDLYLCWKIAQLGYEIYELKDVKIGHQMLMTKAKDITNNGGDTIKIVYIENESKT